MQVERNYLALRSEPALERENEIGKLYTGYIVAVLDTSDPQYWMVYSWDLLKYGYVNKDYLTGNSSSGPSYSYPRTVKVSDGYLALRNAPGYDYRNEIGQLQNGDLVDITGPTVAVKNDFQGKTTNYTWVTVKKSKTCSSGKSGYVNASYLHHA